MVSSRVIRNLKKEFRQSGLAKLGLALVVVIVLTAVFAPFIAPHNPTDQQLNQSELPPIGFSETTERTSSQMVDGEIQTVTEEVEITAEPDHVFGTDGLGRDMFSRVVYGARTSLVVGVLGTLLAASIGVPVGLLAGYHRGRVDDALMRIADVSLAFPSLVLAVALIGLWGRAAVDIPDPFVVAGLAPEMPESFVLPITVVIVVGLVNWVWFARVARGEALSLRGQEYVKASRALGADDNTIILRHILPNAITPIIVLGTVQVAAIILLESSLSFLGFSGTTLSWGFDIAQGRDYVSSGQWWIASIPGLAIMLSVIGINLLGDWLRDALDPGIEGEGGAA
ncbi:binding-protein-dependent transporters inner membrane component [Halorubrum distributum JCM 9100]|uniref:Binding-protein-dependent transporters inner membrane component n=6 Tax=Halorubrum distributum TaxID=29283 RepID=M0EJY7_9EURY|nr:MULTISPECIES: ABC transporter permease [Halorubrum distributum group]PHQ47568.1 ABC transporter permease [Halorubrum sp. C3]ELZ34170.1 binding-protein-dependent transporters inner membrane component [Halorubrum terrestre JCM 10247]ELZ48081.1 binding-protein-dependent transporters inner membrane component [Halorubrum distributum JCM 9100]ELZ54356.1 binding-protein-dependent transporters inner membrane component [Halorubrum distributum JCM 10118]EMA61732.1 binding-protein-dependent transporte